MDMGGDSICVNIALGSPCKWAPQRNEIEITNFDKSIAYILLLSAIVASRIANILLLLLLL